MRPSFRLLEAAPEEHRAYLPLLLSYVHDLKYGDTADDVRLEIKFRAT
jgi:hypothetical protein